MNSREYDVVVVGAGPVGLTAAALLGKRGHRVGVLERFRDIYPLPRAISLDADVMRIFQSLEIVDDIAHELVPLRGYRWLGADGEEILHLKFGSEEPMGWPEHFTFWQPTVDAALNARAMREPTVDILRGVAVESVVEGEGEVRLRARFGTEDVPGEWEPTERTIELSAEFMIGADGANSLVREQAGIDWIDLGFNESWLVVDVLPEDMSRWPIDTPEQHCDPGRPTTLVPNGAHHRRWEFMCMSGEKREDFADAERIWDLLARYVDPAEAEIVRSAVYEFRSLVVRQMRRGQIVLAGDAAHLMPPFMGQGMCSGIRDAANLAWRLDLILDGLASADLLDAYEVERGVHSRAMIDLSIQMGRVSCTIDPLAAAARDHSFRSGEVPPPPPTVPGLEDGTLKVGDDPVAGILVPQGRMLDADGTSRRTDEVLGTGFLLICADRDPRDLLSADQIAFLAQLGCEIVSTGSGADEGVADLDGTHARFLADHGITALIRRPDWYGYGSVADVRELPALIDSLQADLMSPVEADAEVND